MTIDEILKNINEVESEVKSLSSQPITLCLATKTQSKEMLMALADKVSDILIYGDNKAQELVSNYFPHEKVVRHFIGTLQTNKVKYVIDKVSLIHSVDTVNLAQEIDKQARKHGLIMDVLIEVSICGEESKGGVPIDELDKFCEQLSMFSNVRVKGIMTMLPNNLSDKEKEILCVKARSVFDKVKLLVYDNFVIDTLSMGMSNDYRIAVAKGANMIRLGTRIFGERRKDDGKL